MHFFLMQCNFLKYKFSYMKEMIRGYFEMQETYFLGVNLEEEINYNFKLIK